MMKRLVVGISGADGVRLGIRFLQRLRELPQVETHLVMTPNAISYLEPEGGMTEEQVRALADHSYAPFDMAARISSGSFDITGMVVVPCSMKTLACIAQGVSENLLTRAADVCLKERRRLILMTRETPLSLIHIRNMALATEAGCVIMPPIMSFYCRPGDIQDMEDHLIGKALRLFDIELPGFKPWEGR